MDLSVIISIGGALGQLLIGGIFLGRIDQRVNDLVKRNDRADSRCDAIEQRLIDHGERIRGQEMRTTNCQDCRVLTQRG